jgi:hypothetical protein
MNIALKWNGLELSVLPVEDHGQAILGPHAHLNKAIDPCPWYYCESESLKNHGQCYFHH